MKFSLSTLFIFIFSISLQAQNVLIVNNSGTAATGDHVYSDIQSAVDASVSGDIIQIVPSPTSYGSVTISGKSNLTIVGAGFNAQLNSEIVPYYSLVGNMGIDGDSENITIKGIRVSSISMNSVSNIVIEDSHLFGIFISDNSSTVLVRRNFIEATSVSASFTNISGIVYSNNIIDLQADFRAYNAVLDHNLFRIRFLTGSNNTYSNNIFLYQGNGDTDNSIFISNYANVDVVTGTNTGSSNIVTSFELSDIMASEEITSNNWNELWDPTPSEPSILNGGNDGTDIGPTGGVNPYRVTSFTVPTITGLITPTSVRSGENINATIKAKGN